MACLSVRLHDGLPLTIHDEELATDAVAEYSPADRQWAARIDWSLVRPWSAEPVAEADA